MRKINNKSLVGEKLLSRSGYMEIATKGDTICHESGALILVSGIGDDGQDCGEPICLEKKEIKKVAGMTKDGEVTVAGNNPGAVFTQGENKTTTRTLDELSHAHVVKNLKEDSESDMVDGIYFDIEALEKIVIAAKKFSDKNRFGSKLVKMTLKDNMLSIMGKNKNQDQEFLGLLMKFEISDDVEAKGEQW